MTAPNQRGAGYRIVTGIGSSIIRQVIGSAESLLLVPMFLRAWGPDVYGQWVTVIAAVTYIAALDLGAQSYVGNLLAMAHANGDEQRFSSVLSEVMSLFVFVGVGGLVVIALLVSGVVHVPSFALHLDGKTRWVFLFLAGNTLLAVVGGVYGTVFQATGLYALGAMLGNAAKAGGILLGASLLWFRMPPVLYAAGVFATCASLTTTLVIVAARRVPATRAMHISTANAGRAIKYLPGAIHFWLISFAQNINTQGPVLVIAASGQMSLVSVYATHRALANVATYATSFVQGPLTPELSWLAARRQSDQLSEASVALVKVNIVATGFMALLVYIVAPRFYPAWTGHRFALTSTLLTLLLVQAVVASAWTTANWSALAANRHRAAAYWSVANAVLTIAVAWLLFPTAGIVGVAGASLAADVVCGFLVFPRLGARVSGTRPSTVYRAMARAVLPVIALLVFAKIAISFLDSWPAATVFVAGGALLAYPVVCFLLGGELARWIMLSLKGAVAGRTR